ncbi:MAG: tol-pal system protein YbgF [Candidatus Eisenbacteria bacterium]
MRPITSALSLLAAAVVLAGCYGKALVRGPITTQENADAISRIREDQLDADERLARLEELTTEQVELLRELKADWTTDREESRRQLQALEERFTESADRVGRVEGKVDRLLYRSGQAPPPSETRARDSTAVVIDPKPLYDAAYLDLIRGNYKAALAGFEAFLQAYPLGALSDDARYWIGECYLAEGNPREAASHFLRVEQEFADSERVPAALLKLATCHLELGEKQEARKVLTRIVEKHPGAVEASLAKERLRETG